MSSQSNQAGYIPNTVKTGDAACEGRKSITTIIDFTIGLTFQLDLTLIQQMQNWIKSVQCLYVDNADNADAKTIIMGVTNQRIIVPANSQGYYPILQPDPPVLQFKSSVANTLKIQVLNFFLPPYIWGPTGSLIVGTVSVADAILDGTVSGNKVNVRTSPNGVIATDHSGTITVGGTGQVLMLANGSRGQWNLQNPVTATEKLQFSKIGITGPWYDLNAGSSVADDGSTVYQGEVWILGATTGHAFTADEG